MEDYKIVKKVGLNAYPDRVLHPGKVLRVELENRKLLTSNFAMDIKVYPSHFSDILNGKRNINPALAIKLEKALGISAEYWLRLQVKYDLAKERKKLEMA
ncbi:MAG: HigA family addiction module antitoxin [Bacteroidota bacterium]|nr:HigA family addiction module antitoxin [Bacteroidota bacterium]